MPTFFQHWLLIVKKKKQGITFTVCYQTETVQYLWTIVLMRKKEKDVREKKVKSERKKKTKQ